MQERVAPPLWRATVPVFTGVLDRMEAELAQAEARLGEGFAKRWRSGRRRGC